MASSTSNIGRIQQNFMNNITQDDQQNCTSAANNTANNNTVIVNGAYIRGDFFGVSAATNTDASCLLVSNMQDSVSNILSATLTQTNKAQTDWFNGFQFTSETNEFDMSQSVTNNISQINQATCAANSIQSGSDNYIYFRGTVDGNFVGVSSDASANSSCSIENTMKNTTYNQAQAQTNQNNLIQGVFATFLAAFLAIVGIIVIAVIIMFSVGAIGMVGYNKASSRKEKQQQQQEEMAMIAQNAQLSDLPPSAAAEEA